MTTPQWVAEMVEEAAQPDTIELVVEDIRGALLPMAEAVRDKEKGPELFWAMSSLSGEILALYDRVYALTKISHNDVADWR